MKAPAKALATDARLFAKEYTKRLEDDFSKGFAFGREWAALPESKAKFKMRMVFVPDAIVEGFAAGLLEVLERETYTNTFHVADEDAPF